MRWRVYLCKPRRRDGPHWQLQPRRRVAGKQQDGPRIATRITWPEREQAARQLAARYELELNAGVAPTDPAAAPTIDYVFRLRIADLERDTTKSPNTARNYENARRALLPLIGELRVEELRRRHLLDVQRAIGRERAPSTVRSYLSIAAAVHRWAKVEEIIPDSCEWPDLGHLKVRAKVTRKRPYTDAEVQGVLDWLAANRPDVYPVVQLLADTTARVNAVLSLRVQDVDLENSLIHFQTQWRGKGPGGRWGPLKTGETKTLPVPRETLEALPHPNPYGLYFGNLRDPRRPRRCDHVRDAVGCAVEALGIADGDRLDVHSFRRGGVHSFRRLEAEGVVKAVAMGITGHKSEKVYEGYDRHGGEADMAAKAEAVRLLHARRKQHSTRPESSTGSGKILHQRETQAASPEALSAAGGLRGCNRAEWAEGQARAESSPSRDEEASPPESAHEEPRAPSILWTLDPLLARLAGWADADPDAMRRLLTDAALRAQLLAALGDVIPEALEGDHGDTAAGVSA